MTAAQYPVLKPIFFPTGEFQTGMTRSGAFMKQEFQRVVWEQIGTATSMADAKAKFGGAPVLGTKEQP